MLPNLRPLIPICFAFLMFTRLDGHKVWVDPEHIVAIQGAGQLGYNTGTLISGENGEHYTVQEDVNQVVRAVQHERKSDADKGCRTPGTDE